MAFIGAIATIIFIAAGAVWFAQNIRFKSKEDKDK